MPKVSEEHKTKVKETIMKAAIKNFSKTGFAITKMDDIAKTADVSKGTLYLYFQSKEDLFESICKSNQQILIDKRSGLFQNNVDMNALSSGIIALFDGLFLSELIGTNHEDNKKAWIKTMMAIFEGTGM
jgi:AcrR family transcriptional regulator